jgi:hypothetical protein
MQDLHYFISYWIHKNYDINVASKILAVKINDEVIWKGVVTKHYELMHFNLMLTELSRKSQLLGNEIKEELSETCLKLFKVMETPAKVYSPKKLRLYLTQQGEMCLSLLNLHPIDLPFSSRKFIRWYFRNLQMKKLPTSAKPLLVIARHLALLSHKLSLLSPPMVLSAKAVENIHAHIIQNLPIFSVDQLGQLVYTFVNISRPSVEITKQFEQMVKDNGVKDIHTKNLVRLQKWMGGEEILQEAKRRVQDMPVRELVYLIGEKELEEEIATRLMKIQSNVYSKCFYSNIE